MTKKIDIIGNGLSAKNLYYPSPDSLRIGCNFSDKQFDPHLLFITDSKMIYSLLHGKKEDLLATNHCIISKRVRNELKKEIISEDILNHHDVFDPPKELTHGISQIPMNSAQYAFCYFYKDFDEINLFGFDFFWTGNNSSTTHQHIENRNPKTDRSKLIEVWKKYWKILFRLLELNQKISIYFPISDISEKDFKDSFVQTYGEQQNISLVSL